MRSVGPPRSGSRNGCRSVNIENCPDDLFNVSGNEICEGGATRAALVCRDSSDTFTSFGDFQRYFETEFGPFKKV